MGVRTRTNFAASGLLGHGYDAGQGARLRTPFATETLAVSTVCALRASFIRLREDGHGRRISMPAKFFRATFHQNTGGLHWHWRKRVRLGVRWFERIGPDQSGDTQVPLGLGVIGFEFGVSERPVVEAGTGDRSPATALDEIDFVVPPVIGCEMDGPSAHAPPVLNGRLHDGDVVGGLAKGVGLLLVVISQDIHADARIVPYWPDLQFVVTKIALVKVWPLFENNHVESGCGQFLRDHTTSGAGADYDEINRGGVIEFLHLAFGSRLRLLPLIVFGVVVAEGRFVGHFVCEPDQLPSRMVVIPAVFRGRKESHDRMQAHEFKESRRFDGSQNLDLLRGVQFYKCFRGRKELAGCVFKTPHALYVGGLLFLVKRHQRTIDKVNHASFTGTGSVVEGNNLSGDGFDLGGLIGGEELKGWGSRGIRGLARMILGVENRWPMQRHPSSAESRRRTDQELSSGVVIHFS